MPSSKKISLFKLDVGTGKKKELLLGRGTVIPIVDGESCGAKGIDIHQVILRPGVHKGRIHYHKGVENIYVILKGRGEILTGKEKIPVKAGDVAFIPPGVPHEPHNSGKTELRLIEIKAPQQASDDFHIVKTF